jgi:flagellar motor switch protein FliG
LVPDSHEAAEGGRPRGGGSGRVKLAGLLLALAVPAGAQTIPLESKAQFERALEQRAESVLLPILGPARSRVVVDATLDFTRIERFEVVGGAGKEDQGALFLWQNVGQEAIGQSELLPGIPEPSPVPGFGGSKSYERQNSFPTEFVKRLSVTVVLDKKVSVELGDELNSILSDVLGIRPDRGDTLSVMRAEFAPAWKTIWYRPDAVSLLFKYGVIALMTLITLIVVAVCFLKLAEAMDSMAQAQGNQLSMDFGEKEGEGGEGGEEEKKDGEAEVIEEEPTNAIYFDIKPSQVETLWEVLHRQEPENIALVVAHLRPEVKEPFLDRLPTKLYSSVVISLGKVKFIEPDVVQTVKEELERRLESAVGGRRQLFTMLDKADMRTKRELLTMLEAQDPELAATVRPQVLLFEDVRWLEPREWSMLLGQVKLDDWAAASFNADPLVRDAVKNQMAAKTWAILEQMTAASKPGASAVDKAQESVIEQLEKLISDGKVENPVSKRKALEPEPIAVAAGMEAEGEAPPAFEEPPALALEQEGPLPSEYGEAPAPGAEAPPPLEDVPPPMEETPPGGEEGPPPLQ